MKSRITVDMDFKSKWKIAYYLAKAVLITPEFVKIEVKPSNSKGFHLIVWSDKRIKLEDQYKLRERLGDDPTRIKLDKKRKIGRNTLFNRKEPITWMNRFNKQKKIKLDEE